jgi:ubiquinone/menaquinone biosynthesis C-methylase UbiE
MKISWEKLEHEWRKELLSHARGKVLEVGAETGNNFKYYPPGVHVTATDMSGRMIEKAKQEAIAKGVKAEFIVSHVEDLQLPVQGFDTIISTFSLSACENPVPVLKRFNNWCRPDGVILMMEYGLSKYGLVNWLQQKWQPYHYRRTGRHINRDMLSLISESRIRIKKLELKYAGIVYLMWASLVPQNGV